MPETFPPTSCTGCSACASVCKHDAIRMMEDKEGFLYPSIDETKCIGCGLCEKTCPAINGRRQNDGGDQHVFLITTHDERHYKNSATAGVCTIAAEHVLENNGKVFGVELSETDWKARHVCISDKEGIERIRNSKYVQSDTCDTFREVKKLLEDGIKVLYTGTPCQIAGLKAFLRKDYDSLITIEIICHGIYSYRLLQKEVGYWEQRLGAKVHNFKFRSKRKFPWIKGGIINFDATKNGKTTHHEYLGPYSPTYRCYAYADDGISYNLRKSCYACQFRDRERYADITVGDSWFLHHPNYKKFSKADFHNGISLVVCNTGRGKALLDSIGSHFTATEIPYDDAFIQPAMQECNREIPQQREAIYSNLDTEDYGKLVERLLNVDLIKQEKIDKKKKLKKDIKEKLKKYLLIKKFRYLKNKYSYSWQYWFTNFFLSGFPSKRFRNFMLKRYGMKFLGDARLYAGFHIRNPKGITLGDGVSVGPRVLLDGRMGLTIEEGAVIGYGAIIWTLNHDYNDINFCGKGAPVVIGKRAWVCSNSITLPGVTIGEGAVVASGAVVTKDVEPYTVVGGVPAKVIGHREKKDYQYGYKKKDDTLYFG